MSSDQAPYVLRTTPPFGTLPATDIDSIYYAALLQLVVPKRWAIQMGSYTTNDGKLPSIEYMGRNVQPRQLSSMPGWKELDGDLTKEERADCLIWRTYIDQTITDLVHHTMYSLPPNYFPIGRAQIEGLHFPENGYIAQRVRGMMKARLQHVGLWGLGGVHDGDAVEEDKKRLEEAFVTGPGGTQAPRVWSGLNSGREKEARRRKFGEQEVLRRAKQALDPLVRRLGDGPYFIGDKPRTVDLILYANLSLVLVPKHPNPLFANLIRESYPSLADFHERLDTLLESTNGYANIPRLPFAAAKTMVETVTSWFTGQSSEDAGGASASGEKKKRAKDPKQKAFERGRWLWFAGAAGAMITYLFASGMISVQLVGDDDAEEEEEDDEDEEDEDEEGFTKVAQQKREALGGQDGESEASRSPLDGLVADDDDDE